MGNVPRLPSSPPRWLDPPRPPLYRQSPPPCRVIGGGEDIWGDLGVWGGIWGGGHDGGGDLGPGGVFGGVLEGEFGVLGGIVGAGGDGGGLEGDGGIWGSRGDLGGWG